MQFSVKVGVHSYSKGAYCLLLISAIILFDALSVGMVVNAFGHANSLQLTTLQPKLKSQSPTPLFQTCQIIGLFDIF